MPYLPQRVHKLTITCCIYRVFFLWTRCCRQLWYYTTAFLINRAQYLHL